MLSHLTNSVTLIRRMMSNARPYTTLAVCCWGGGRPSHAH